MIYAAIAMAVVSLFSSSSKRKKANAAKVADAVLQRKRLEKARVRKTEDFVENSQRAKEATMKREIQIESNRLDAESKLAETFAGSGIGGTSVQAIDSELNNTVQKNKIENKEALDDQLGDLTRDFSRTMNDTADEAASIDTTAVKGSPVGDLTAAADAASKVMGYGEMFGSGSKGAATKKKPQGGSGLQTNGTYQGSAGGYVSPKMGIGY